MQKRESLSCLISKPDRDIIQLSAFDGNSELNVYVHLRSNQPISKNDTAVFGITFSFEKDIVNYKGRNVKINGFEIRFTEILDVSLKS